MDQMKAIVKRSEKPADLALQEVRIPAISENELLIQVKAIGVGIHDGYFLPKAIHYPYPIGIEAAGVIEEVGEKVTSYQKGDRVAFVSSMQVKGGTWAEYAVVADSSLIIPIPEGMSFKEAAAVPVAGNTVLKALKSLDLQKDDTVFIAGASGAIGTFAIQLAVAKGCRVAGSASIRNHNYMISLGAEKVVDYHDADWTEQIKQWQPDGVDAVMAIQPNTASVSAEVLKEGGKIVAVSGDQFRPQKPINIKPFPYQDDVSNELLQLMEKIYSGTIQLVIEQEYPFERALEALRKTETRRARGKLVITMP
ncbi:NADP-dependent oxidoreductase [Sporosarcina sp. PTS2304]|uniref:quinone oxidoreductase family protein n=1 Tax=Sporosarcina sp. PTS2304 TaxID=2283194 RepID=UPI000E0D7277|nr:NADP-dependent oxidoreductase [Sporosarcina sp. PTS2304]AXI00251.1 NADP-dependent oxidoreductase [Sporosarcina sp. PTS2304]